LTVAIAAGIVVAMSVLPLAEGDPLTADHVRRLARGDLAAIRVAGFIDPAVADAMVAWMAGKAADDYHVVTDRGQGPERIKVGVSRIGCPLNELVGAADPDQEVRAYLATARTIEAEMREVCAPHARPIDSLTAALAAAWPAGVVVAQFGDEPLFAGIPRIVHAGAELLESQPHVDAVHPSALQVDHQISANLYLDVPPSGGGLEVWPGEPLTLEAMFQPALMERLQRGELGPSEVITPSRGELVVINSRRPHAVRQFFDGRRFSVQCFIGVPDGTAPLVLWS
jgi:hypothetical protein